MSTQTFFWHDYETFGRSPRRDRPAQFAGIRTDVNLNEIDEPVMLYCRPAPDTLPDPESCLLTGILPQTCIAQGDPEHVFAAAIERELGQAGTIGLGYNTLRFDDEVTRFLFWRNLIEPYAREWQNQCGRWDLLDVVRCAWALRPEGIKWPAHADGRPSFRLEDLSAANGLAHEAAHDALSDVRATIALARLVRERQPRLFDFCLGLRPKDAVLREMGIGRPFLHISGMYGVERGCMALVWPLAPHPVNRNEMIVWDLSADPAELFEINAEAIRARLFVRNDALSEGVTRLPIKTIHINRSPIVISNLKTLPADRARHFGLDIETALVRAQVLAERGHLLAGLWADVFARKNATVPTDVDEDLYGGFIGQSDRRLLERLRTMTPEELAHSKPAFEDERLEELLFRYRARNFPETLLADDQARWQAHCRSRLHAGDYGFRTLPEFFEQIDILSETADERAEEILGALYDYAESIAPPLR